MCSISVIIPAYNCEKYINKCLESILCQTFKDYEILIINDGSTDLTPKLINKYKSSVNIINIKNHGQAFARNLGLMESKGKYICFVDSDDYLEQDCLEKLYKTAIKYNSDLTYCFINRFYEYNPSFLEKKFTFDHYNQLENPINLNEHKELITKITIAPFAKLIRKEFIIKHGIEFLNGKIYEDLLFTLTLLVNSPKLSMVSEKLYNYRVRRGSTMTNKNSKILDIFYIFDLLYSYCKANNLLKDFKDEIDFLMIYHIGIGTVYRLFRSKPTMIIENIRLCSEYLGKYNILNNNKYLRSQPLSIRLYIKTLMLKY